MRRVMEWIKKNQDPCICCLQETHFRPKDTQTESEGMEKYIPCKYQGKKARVAILTRHKKGHCTMIQGSVQQEDITIVNISAPNTGAPIYIEEILTFIKGEIDSRE